MADETGWETEEDDEDLDDEDAEDILGEDDDFGDDIIASDYCESCETYHRVGKRFCLDPNNLPQHILQPPSLHQLALTSKFFRKLVLPHIHEGVDFEAIDNRKLERYLELIVPKYGQFVKEVRLVFGPCPRAPLTALASVLDTRVCERERRILSSRGRGCRTSRPVSAGKALRVDDANFRRTAKFSCDRRGLHLS